MNRLVVIFIAVVLSGCMSMGSGIPGLANKATEGGFVVRSQEPGMGFLVNQGNTQLDIDIYVRETDPLNRHIFREWMLYEGDAKFYDGKKWQWIKGLTSVHMEPNQFHSGSLRYTDGRIIKFNTSSVNVSDNRRYNRYDRYDQGMNVLPLILPSGDYMLKISSYSGRGPFRRVVRRSFETRLRIDKDPTDHLFGGYAVGWLKKINVRARARQLRLNTSVNDLFSLGRRFLK